MSEWIACSDRLPEYERDTPCLVSSSHAMYISDWEPEYQEFEFGHSIITHWMPLPEPPKESGE